MLRAMKKNKVGKGTEKDGLGTYRMVLEDSTEKIAFEYRHKGGEGISHVSIWKRLFQAERTVSC